ncbi:hypothetical protein JCM39194_25340 [Desulfotomaculum varum]
MKIKSKKILAGLMLLILILSPAISLAGTAWAAPGAAEYDAGYDNNSPYEEDNPQDEGGVFEQIIASLLEALIKLAQFLGSKTAGLQPVDKLVFLSDLEEAEKKIAPWTGNEKEFLNLWFLAMTGVVLPFYIISIAVSFIKLMTCSGNPAGRSEAIQSIWRWFGALIITVAAPVLVESLTWLTSIFLDGIQYAFQLVAQESGINRTPGNWGAINFGGVAITTGSILGTVLVKLMFAVFWAWINVVYVIRKIVLSGMFCFTPLMALMWSVNKNTTAIAVWLGELASNAFMPVAHALVLCTILGFMDVKNINQQGTWFQILIAIYTIMPLAEVIRNTLQTLFTRMAGLNEEHTAKKAMAAAMGLGGILSLSRVFRSTLGADNPSIDATPPTSTGGGIISGSTAGRLTPTPVGPKGTIPQTIGTKTNISNATTQIPGNGGSSAGTSLGINNTVSNLAGSLAMTGKMQTGKSPVEAISNTVGTSKNTATPNITVSGSSMQDNTGAVNKPDTTASTVGNNSDSKETKPSLPKQMYENIKQTMHNPQKAAEVFGGMAKYSVGTAIRTVSEAVPGGEKLGHAAANIAEGGARVTGAAAATALQLRKTKAEEKTTYREALKKITGKESTISAAGSAVNQIFSAAAVKNNTPKYNSGGSSLDSVRWKQ